MQYVTERFRGHDIISLDICDSTNLEAERYIKAKITTTPTIITCQQQLSGKGRGGNKWLSHQGNLMFSHILPLLCLSKPIKKNPHILQLISALALLQAIKELYDIKLMIKWPNDLVFCENAKTYKIAGQLSTKYYDNIIIGTGINILHEPDSSQITGKYPAISINTIAENNNAKNNPNNTLDEDSKNEILKKYIANFEYLLHKKTTEQEQQDIISLCEQYLFALGQQISFKLNNKVIEGNFLGINANGLAIIAQKNGEIGEFMNGEMF